MADIFISYTRDDRAIAQSLAMAFERQGWSTWWDARIRAGSNFDEVIEVELSKARCVVVLWSKLSVRSRWVKEEANEGLERGILVPVFIENTKAPLGFRTIHGASLVEWRKSDEELCFRELLEDMVTLIGERVQDSMVDEHVEREQDRSKNRPILWSKKKLDRLLESGGSPVVMISGTVRYLPAYREVVKEACLSAGMFPTILEDLPDDDYDAIESSLKMVDESDIYIGIYAHKYGHLPRGSYHSIAHMEYDRAKEREMPCFLFVIDQHMPIGVNNIDIDEPFKSLVRFLDRVKTERDLNLFSTPFDLHAKVKHQLADFRSQFLFKVGEVAQETSDIVDNAPSPLLPPLPHLDPPPRPFRYLSWFRREDALVFFGRERETAELCEALTASWSSPLMLMYGESGIGKSSLLAAGVSPRLEAEHCVYYLRRNIYGLLDSVSGAFGVHPEGLVNTWHKIEKDTGKPLIVIIDQVEEVYTSQEFGGANEEMLSFIGFLHSLFSKAEMRPRGRILLSFRKEWVAEIEQRISEASLPFQKIFLERLSYQSIIDIVNGVSSNEALASKYLLTIEEGLGKKIAEKILLDAQSPVAPVLSIILSNMWQSVENNMERSFTYDLYSKVQGVGLSEYVTDQLYHLDSRNSEALQSGLVLDILKYHSTQLGTAEVRTRDEVLARYSHRKAILLTDLLEICTNSHLLSKSISQDGEISTRLAHDTLAPIILQLHRDSDMPGQRAERILLTRSLNWVNSEIAYPLSKEELGIVESGLRGMRVLNVEEERLMSLSRKAYGRKRIQKISVIGLFILLLGIIAFLAGVIYVMILAS